MGIYTPKCVCRPGSADPPEELTALPQSHSCTGEEKERREGLEVRMRGGRRQKSNGWRKKREGEERRS